MMLTAGVAFGIYLKGAIGAWLTKKAIDASVESVLKLLTPDQLHAAIQTKLSGSKELKQLIQPAPSLAVAHFTKQHAKQITRLATGSDTRAMAAYMLTEQLVRLPLSPDEPVTSYDEVWKCVADATLEAIHYAVINDAKYCREFMLFCQLQQQSDTQTLLAGNENTAELLTTLVDRLPEKDEALSRRHHDRAIRHLSEAYESLEKKLTAQLDSKTEDLWKHIVEALRLQNFTQAIALASDLHSWVESERQISDEIRARAYLLLAQVSFLEVLQLPNADSHTYDESQRLFAKGLQYFGDSLSPENEARIISFKAKLLSLRGSDGEALALLGTSTEPQLLLTRILVLIDECHFEQAAQCLEGIPLDEKWCDHACLIYAYLGNSAKVNSSIEWAQATSDSILAMRCRIMAARGLLMQYDTDSAENIGTEPYSSPNLALDWISPVAEACRVRGSVINGLEADAVAYSCRCHKLLGDPASVRQFARLLDHWRPVPLEYANCVHAGILNQDATLATKLREDYPSHLPARILACAIEIESTSNWVNALENAVALVPLASDADERAAITRLLFYIAVSADRETTAVAQIQIQAFAGELHPINLLARAYLAFQADSKADVEPMLQAAIDAGAELQLVAQFRAHVLLSNERLADAAQVLLEAGRELKDTSLLRRAASAANAAKPARPDLVIQAIQAIPETKDVIAYRLLAKAYTLLEGFAQAADCFQHLIELEPDDASHLLNKGICLARTAKSHEALTCFEQLGRIAPISLRGCLAHATLLRDIGEVTAAIDLMDKQKAHHWDDVAFLSVYLTTAYAANRDRSAHEAFQQILKLQREGKAPPTLLQPKTTDDYIAYQRELKQQNDVILDSNIAGKLPWLFLNDVPYYAWYERTQPLEWCRDEARVRAAYSLYSTNSYAVLQAGAAKKIVRITASSVDSPAVCDVSALITLHRLSLLETAIKYFGTVVIPPSYLAKAVPTAGRLLPQQLSQRELTRAIASKLNKGAICVTDDNTNRHQVSESTDAGGQTVYVVSDILDALKQRGLLRPVQEELIRKQRLRPSTTIGTERALTCGCDIALDLAIANKLVRDGLLEAVCSTFSSVSISTADRNLLMMELEAFDQASMVHELHANLWSLMAANQHVDSKRLLTAMHVAERNVESEGADHSEYSTLDAAELAKQEQLPLLVDDRVLQNMVLRVSERSASAAFGTDCLLMKLHAAGLITHAALADAFLQLMNWRYRFLLLPASVIETISKEFSKNDLNRVALYVHDCMRDYGLFNAPEDAEPPIPLAIRYFKDWTETLVEFVVKTWVSDADEERKKELTDWALTECMPSIPLVLGDRANGLAHAFNFIVVSKAMGDLIMTDDRALANRILREIAARLHFDEAELTKLAFNVIDAYGK